MAASMDLDHLQAEALATDSVAWSALIGLRALKAGLDGTDWLASLPRSAAGLAPGGLWVDVVANKLVYVTS